MYDRLDRKQWDGHQLERLCADGRLGMAIDYLLVTDNQDSVPSRRAYDCVLQLCSREKDLEEAKRLLAHVCRKGLVSDCFVGESLVSVFAKCESPSYALHVFNLLPRRTVFSWTAIISVYSQIGEGEEALKYYKRMQEDGVIPNKYTFVSVLKACGNISNLVEGKRTHAEVVRRGWDLDIYICTALVDMYSRCGSMVDAQLVFDNVLCRDRFLWTAMISGYAELEQASKALGLYGEMLKEGFKPDARTFLCVLKACGSTAGEEKTRINSQFVRSRSLQLGKAIHGEAARMGYGSDSFVGGAIIRMYARCGSTWDAQCLFDIIPQYNVVLWNVMIGMHAGQEQGCKAVELYAQMREAGVSPDHRTFVSVIKASSSIAAGNREATHVDGHLVKLDPLHCGHVLHAEVIRRNLATNLFIATALVDMYARCGSVVNAWNVFNLLVKKDVAVWTAMIMGYVQQEEWEESLGLYVQMQEQGYLPDELTIASILKLCGGLGSKEEGVDSGGQVLKVRALEKGKLVHFQATVMGYESNELVCSAILHMYARCGSLVDAQYIFGMLDQPNVVQWNVMISGYVEQGQGEKALELYARMRGEGTVPDDRTFVSILKACGSLGVKEKKLLAGTAAESDSLVQGRTIHAEVVKYGYQSDVFVCNTLVHMYACCGSIWESEQVFRTVHQQRDVVSWNAMITGYVQNGKNDAALQHFSQMKEQGVQPNEATFVCVIRACSNSGALSSLVQIHREVFERGILCSSAFVGSALMHAYSMCGSMLGARDVLNLLPQQNVCSWTTLVAGYAKSGDYEMSMLCFDQMQQKGIQPDSVTFLCLLSACSHAGMVDKGLELFGSMIRDHRIPARVEHFVTMFDMLGRAGLFSRVDELISTMDLQPERALWLALLGACRKYGNVELGEHAFESLLDLDRYEMVAYIE